MENFLTANAIFVCNQGGVIHCEDSGNKSVCHNGAELLTTSATLKSKSGICSILIAATQGQRRFCECHLTAWIPGFSPLKTSNAHPLLTDSAKNFCTFGGTISVKISGVFDKITKGTAPPAMNLAPSKLVESSAAKSSAAKSPAAKSSAVKSPAAKSSAAKSSAAKSSAAKSSAAKSSAAKSSAAKSSAAKSSAAKSSAAKSSAAKSSAAKSSAAESPAENFFKCSVCQNSATCEYVIRGRVEEHKLPPIVRNNATSDNDDNDLRQNYFQYLEETSGIANVRKNLSETFKDKTGDLDFYRQVSAALQVKGSVADRNFLASLCRQLELIQRDNKIPWGYEAHHLIPINEIFVDFPKSVLVANLGKFDLANPSRRVFNINCAENCIILLSYNRDKKFETLLDRLQKNFGELYKKFFSTPEENATYELMKIVEREHKFKIQWHVGRHTYSFKKSEVAELSAALREKISQSNLIDYKTAVYTRMLDVENAIDLKKICPRNFRENILKLAADIREHLSAFSQDPCKSYPFFVTKSNYYYALLENFSGG